LWQTATDSRELKFWNVPYELTNKSNFHEFVQRRAILFEEYPFIVVNLTFFVIEVDLSIRLGQRTSKLMKSQRLFQICEQAMVIYNKLTEDTTLVFIQTL